MFKYFTLDNFDFKGRVVGLRIDINSPIINGKITLNERIIAHSKTIEYLRNNGAKIIILAHQGRKGKPDFISLKEHSKLLSEYLKIKIDFINEIYSEKVVSKIKSMNNSDVLLLENLRFFEDEKNPNKKDNLILKLESLFDYYVFDAFSVSHREQTSVIGFNKIPNIAGLVMEKELKGLNKIEETPRDHTYVFGGAKPDDLVDLMEIGLKNGSVDLILLSGVIGEIALHLKGFNIGKKFEFLKEHNFLDSINRIEKLLKKYPDKILIPKDVAYEAKGKRIELNIKDFEKKKDDLNKYLIQDIGTETINYYNLHLKTSGSIYFKGPPGNFELKNFQKGTIGILKGITSSNAFKFMGGGHSVTSLKEFGFINDFDYISLAGGALVKYLSGKELPGVKHLEKSFELFDKVFDDFVVIGSNTIDTEVSVPNNFSEFHLGDKIKLKEDFKTSVGGGGVNVSICLSRLGARVGYLGKLSYENLEFIKDFLDKNKINLIENKLSKRPVAKSIILDTLDNDRIIFTYKGQNDFLEEKDINYDLFKSNNFYFNSLGGDSFNTVISMMKKIKRKNSNSNICYNPSLYLIKNKKKELRILLKYVDILILNYEEIEELVGEGSISDCLIRGYKLGPKLVIITDGKNGAFAFDGNKEYHQKAFHSKVVDTTGAGDSFAGTFFYFYSKGFGIKKSLKYAAMNSASVVGFKGTTKGLKFYDELIKEK